MTTPDRFIAGAVDLSGLADRAKAPAPSTPAGGGASSTFFDVTRENLEAEVIGRSAKVPVVVQIGSTRSPDSEQLKADLAALAAAGGGRFAVGYVDADTAPELAQALGARAVPTVVAVAAGQPVANFEGGQPKEALEQWTQALVTQLGPQLQGPDAPVGEEQVAPADPRMVAAAEALERGDAAAAIEVYDAILANEPRNTEAIKARDTARLMQRLSQRTSGGDPVAEADADPADVAKAFDAADAQLIAGTPEAAFDRLIALLPNKQVQQRLVELFELFEAADPRVLAARSKMASALF